jgi:hypothetical protein
MVPLRVPLVCLVSLRGWLARVEFARKVLDPSSLGSVQVLIWKKDTIFFRSIGDFMMLAMF